MSITGTVWPEFAKQVFGNAVMYPSPIWEGNESSVVRHALW